MALGITEEHDLLAATVRSFFADRYPGAAREALEAGGAARPKFWSELADLGWLGLHVAEDYEGSGYGLPELAVVIEEMGRVCAPGPFLPTVVASALVSAIGSAEQKRQLLPGLTDGSVTAGLGLWGSLRWTDGPASALTGEAGPVVGAHGASILLLAVGADVVLVDAAGEGLQATSATPEEASRQAAPEAASRRPVPVDPTRPAVAMTCTSLPPLPGGLLRGGRSRAQRILGVLGAAEASGAAAACTEMASAYAKVRQAFGRQIGQFQAVKHHCANMFVASELAAAAAWDAARAEHLDDGGPFAEAAGTAVALDALASCARLNIQVHGGIGYTWEHDAHLYLRRSAALDAMLGGAHGSRVKLAELAASGRRRAATVELPPEAQGLRSEVRDFRDSYLSTPAGERHRLLVESGYLFPHWPKPWGLAAGPVEQLVIDEELSDVDRAGGLGPNAWILPIMLPTLITHGTGEQKQRWIRPSLSGELVWCQLFSEPDAGSDLAALRTSARKVEGGWLVTGSKVWTSTARSANIGFALVRTDSDAPRHAGITCMAIDMHAPGVELRPLRDLGGGEVFYQEFLDEVFVPDTDVIGEVNQGWLVARSTLGNERTSLGEWVNGIDDLLAAVARDGELDRTVAAPAGELIARAHVLQLVNLRQAMSAIAGRRSAIDGNVTKLAAAEHEQHLADFLLQHAGPAALTAAGPADRVLFDRRLTIAGGTSEIVRNTIAERLLGLPRDPRPPATGT
jgi:alkylation response protein AidB-like acyl-CoA dehydrogenase